MKVVLKGVRLAFPDLWTAVQYQGKGSFRFGATFLVEPGSINDKNIHNAINEAAAESFGVKSVPIVNGMRGNSNKFCYQDGNTKDYDGFADMMYLAAHRPDKQGAPLVIDANKAPLTATSGKPYAGCYVNASVDIYAQKGENQGIRASLLAVQFFKDGDAFAGSRANPDDFEDLSEGADSADFASVL